MLLIVFGAGASFDSVPHLSPSSIYPAVRPLGLPAREDNRPPLANQLFDTRPRFVEAMQRFPEMLEIVPLLRKPGVLVERELAALRDQTMDFPRAYKELAALLFYLHFSIWECQRYWFDQHRGINNYVTLLREVERWRLKANEHVLVVTFNYDTMVEDAISQVLGVAFDGLEKYISQAGYSVIKLHGSINWGHELQGFQAHSAEEVIARAANLAISKEISFVNRHPMIMSSGNTGYPALSIPVEQKDEFSCPTRHLEALRGALPQVRKVVAIGWRAMEAEFIKMLRTELASEQEILIVSGDEHGANETLANLKVGVRAYGETIVPEYGFTGLINNLAYLERFLNYRRPSPAAN